ncbi:outer dense fiber protein 3-like protein 2 [Ctenocephalides felis]|uniref:outer dense fiber protein 3-like protein 2 n=1 Tax=Ctenocephalides felis TaxID=7515 RepID=UPI000E6E19A4|nr:outer dense fiber protein 3-like protein 2 [Ctenocephalides felis]
MYELLMPPNLYNIPSAIGGSKEAKCPAAPAYTIVGRHPPPKRNEAFPGPGAYDATDAPLQPRPAAYTIRARLPDPSTRTKNPGPGAYYPEKIYKAHQLLPPELSFGVRHTPYKGIPDKHMIQNEVLCTGPPRGKFDPFAFE